MAILIKFYAIFLQIRVSEKMRNFSAFFGWKTWVVLNFTIFRSIARQSKLRPFSSKLGWIICCSSLIGNLRQKKEYRKNCIVSKLGGGVWSTSQDLRKTKSFASGRLRDRQCTFEPCLLCTEKSHILRLQLVNLKKEYFCCKKYNRPPTPPPLKYAKHFMLSCFDFNGAKSAVWTSSHTLTWPIFSPHRPKH